MKAGNFLAVITLLGLLAVSCNQDAVFNKIASETMPKDPLIKGAPTNMVVFGREYPDPDDPNKKITVPIMYVASGRLYWYAKAISDIATADAKPQWNLKEYKIEQPKGNVIYLAVAEEKDSNRQRLYALCRDGNGINATLRYLESDGDKWQTVASEEAEYSVIQSIYADPASKRLFAGASKSNLSTYGILYLDHAANKLKLLNKDTSIFSGAVYRESAGEGIHYLSTRGGIFQISETDLAAGGSAKPLADSTATDNTKADRMFMSIIKLNDSTIIAVERDGGALYEIQDGSFARMQYASGGWINIGKYATGAIAQWEDTERSPPILALVIGIQGGLYSTTSSSHTYGYVEFDLNADGSFNRSSSRRDAGKLQTVVDQDRYTAGMGTLPINHLFQTPGIIDPEKTFFASTQTAGLRSYRYRKENKGWQWNAEE